MQRLRIGPAQVQGETITFRPEQEHQLRSVLRVRPGELIVAVVFGDSEYLVEMAAINRDGVRGRVLQSRPVLQLSGPAVTLAPAVLREQKMDLVVQKSVELGVDRIQPILALRSVARPRPDRVERWRRIAAEAAEQCGRGTIPEIEPPATLAEVLSRSCARFEWWLDEQNRDRGLGDVISRTVPSSVRLFVGPEGGFDPRERELLGLAQVVGVGMGPLVLRAETAAIAALSVISFAFGTLRQPASDHGWPAGESGPRGESGDGIQSSPGG